MALKLAGQDDGDSANSGKNGGNGAGGNPWDAPNDGLNLEPLDATKETNNPWDNGPVRETRSISDNFYDDISTTSVVNTSSNGSILAKISGIIMYIAFVAAIASLIYVASGKDIDVYFNILKSQPLLSIASVIVIIDAFIVFFTEEKRISLLVFAFLLAPFYPSKRSKVVTGSGGIGTWFTLLYIIAIIGLCGKMFSAVYHYGSNLILIPDVETRTQMSVMLDSTAENGLTYGVNIQKYMNYDSVGVQAQGDTTYYMFQGTGDISIAGDSFRIGEWNVPTTLAFAKSSSGTGYEIYSVELNGTPLTGYGAQSYWHVVQNN